MNFKNFLQLIESGGGALLGTDFTGSTAPATKALTGHPPDLPGLDLALPSVVKHGQITHLIKNKNPIYIRLSDGTQLFQTWDEFKRIKGFPEVGRTMTITFQRNQNDFSNSASQVQSITVS